MRNVFQIKGDMVFYEQFSILMETSKMVALAEYRALEKKITTFERFASIINDFFGLIKSRNIDHPFVRSDGKPQGIIIVTSSGGLSGGLDTRIATGALHQRQDEDNALIIVGRKGCNYARERQLEYKEFPGIMDDERLSQAAAVRDYVTGEVLAGRIGAVRVVYAHPVSLVVQRVDTVNLLPCSELIGGSQQEETDDPAVDMIMESSPEGVIEYLAYHWIGQKLFEIFGLSRLAEVAARFMHAEDSAEKISEMSEQLKKEYLRVKHEIVDQQMRELFAARG